MAKILLSTLNSTYQHSSFGLRYLRANLNELRDQSAIVEFTIAQKPEDIAEKILLENPSILGFGVYIWNTQETLKVIQILKKIAPEIVIVLGGPEVSFEAETQEIVHASDYVIQGEADLQFYELCFQLLNQTRPGPKIWKAKLPPLEMLKSPYPEFSEADIKNRILYVEASRGCPYKCEYCLSSLDLSVRNFPIDSFLEEIQQLIQRGARTFKFVDRTFNLSPKISTKILEFFLAQKNLSLFLHFEMVPDRLPQELKVLIEQFPAGSLQFEIGIQTWNPQVAAHVSRRQDYSKVKDNLTYLKKFTKVHSHADLIVGLPGENLESFQVGFDQLVDLEPDEIQVGILKRLKGAPISRHDKAFKMNYASHPPFQILSTLDMAYLEVQEMARFSRFWDMVANSGNFQTLIKEVFAINRKTNSSHFDFFRRLTKFFTERHGQSHGISLLNLTESLFVFLTQKEFWSEEKAKEILIHDYSLRGGRDVPKFLRGSLIVEKAPPLTSGKSVTPKRQSRHLSH